MLDPKTGLLLASTCRAECLQLEKEWIDQEQNKVKGAAEKIFNLVNNENLTLKGILRRSDEKYDAISPPLQFSDVKDISSRRGSGSPEP